jgi:hypothetical protein
MIMAFFDQDACLKLNEILTRTRLLTSKGEAESHLRLVSLQCMMAEFHNASFANHPKAAPRRALR